MAKNSVLECCNAGCRMGGRGSSIMGKSSNGYWAFLNAVLGPVPGVLMDLRFIPDDMEFDGQPKDSANEIPADYEPRLFIASALQQSAVKLTWYVACVLYGCRMDLWRLFMSLTRVPDALCFPFRARICRLSHPTGVVFAHVVRLHPCLRHSLFTDGVVYRDEDEPERMMTLRRKVKNEDIKEMDYAAYIASGSDTESEIDDSDVKEKVASDVVTELLPIKMFDVFWSFGQAFIWALEPFIATQYLCSALGLLYAQYSELMKELRHQDASEEPDQEMEISFEPGLEAKARAALKAKTERDRVENLNVWDQYLEKRKQKRKQKSMLGSVILHECTEMNI